jgi:hypothetical protein
MDAEPVVITAEDLAELEPAPDAPRRPTRMPLWRRLISAVLVLCPPLLFLVGLIDLVLAYRKEATVRHQFAMHYWALLLASCVLWTVAAVIFALWAPAHQTAEVALRNTAITVADLPDGHSDGALSGRDIARRFSPLVVTVFHPEHPPFLTDNGFEVFAAGAGAITYAARDGFLVVTSRHVVEEILFRPEVGEPLGVSLKDNQRALATVVGLHNELDLALLWVGRHYGDSEYVQALRPFSTVEVGEQVYAIGHPAGLSFSLSSGLVSQKRGDDLVQISAPISPGNSGGPVYDTRGHLVGIVQMVVDKSLNPNAENLNFAVRVDDIFTPDAWQLAEQGRSALDAVAARRLAAGSAAEPPTDEETAL